MSADGKGIGPILGDPVRRRQPRIHEKQYIIRNDRAVQDQLGGDHAATARRIVNRAEGHGRKLRAVSAVKDDPVNGVRIQRTSDTVHHHIIQK